MITLSFIALDVGVDARLPEPVELAAYFTVAEALTNAAKHARASVVDVRAYMDSARPCFRHSTRIWMPASADCTDWHLAARRARRLTASLEQTTWTVFPPPEPLPVALRRAA